MEDGMSLFQISKNTFQILIEKCLYSQPNSENSVVKVQQKVTCHSYSSTHAHSMPKCNIKITGQGPTEFTFLKEAP